MFIEHVMRSKGQRLEEVTWVEKGSGVEMALTLGSDRPRFESRPLQAKLTSLSESEVSSEKGCTDIL